MRDGSGIREYRFVVEDTDRHGNVRVYLRHGGRKTRLKMTPGTPEFEAEYQAALDPARSKPAPKKRGPAAPRSLRWLCELYYASPTFLSLDKTTQRVRRSILDHICERHGHKPFAGMQPRDVAKLRDEKKGLPEAANSRVKALRQLFKWAAAPEYGYAQHNPAKDVPYLRSNNPDGHHAWTREEIAQYQEAHPVGTKARLALDLLLYTGVRASDVIALGPQMERQREGDPRRWLHFTEFKGRQRKPKHRELPILPILAETIEATPSGHLSYLVTEFGRPFSTAKSFGNWFKRRCREAGLPHCSAHGLRKAGAIIAAENGATHDDLKALYGWETSKQVDLYTRQAQRNKIAGTAVDRWLGEKG